MLTAKEAFDLSQSKTKRSVDEESPEIAQAIEDAANKGSQGIILNLKIEDCSKLSSLGYQVNWYKEDQFMVGWLNNPPKAPSIMSFL